MTERGKYIVIEGHDGTGKSTQVERLRARLAEKGVTSIEFHEPEGVPIADEIRTIIKNGSLKRDGETNLLLFTAARHEIWKHAEHELANGTWVVAARNYFSTLAYQGYGEGLDLGRIERLTREFTSESYMTPDLAVILSVEDEGERQKRIAGRGKTHSPDTFESKSDTFQEKVKQGYFSIAEPRDIPIVSAQERPEETTERLWQLLLERGLLARNTT